MADSISVEAGISLAVGLVKFIISIFSYIPSFIDLMIKLLSFFVGLSVWCVLHFDITLMLIEAFIIGLALLMTNTNKDTFGNPISLLSNYINLHFKVLAIGFIVIREIFHIIASGIIALTNWIP